MVGGNGPGSSSTTPDGATTAGASSGGGAVTTSVTLTDEQKNAARAGLRGYFDTLGHASTAADNEALLGWLYEHKDSFSGATLDEASGTITAEFVDGDVLLVFNPPTSTQTAKSQTVERSASDTTGTIPPAGPNSTVLLVNAFSSNPATIVTGASNPLVFKLTEDYVNDLKTCFQTEGVGYSPKTIHPADLSFADFKQLIKNVDVLVWGGHGGISERLGGLVLTLGYSSAISEVDALSAKERLAQAL